MFENVDGRRTDGRTDAGVTGILIAHLGAFGSGELKRMGNFQGLSKLFTWVPTFVDDLGPRETIEIKPKSNTAYHIFIEVDSVGRCLRCFKLFKGFKRVRTCSLMCLVYSFTKGH